MRNASTYSEIKGHHTHGDQYHEDRTQFRDHRERGIMIDHGPGGILIGIHAVISKLRSALHAGFYFRFCFRTTETARTTPQVPPTSSNIQTDPISGIADAAKELL